jgi:hypothetical protein
LKQLHLFNGEAVPKQHKLSRVHRRIKKEFLFIQRNDDTAGPRTIKQLMRAPKLLKNAMPRVILKDKYLQRPRSAESEFGLKFVSPKKKLIERRWEQRRSCNRRRRRRYLDNPRTGTRVIMRSGVHFLGFDLICLTFSYCEVRLTLVFPDGRVADRRKSDRRDPPKDSREKPDKYLFNSVLIDPIKHTAKVKKTQLIYVAGRYGLSSEEIRVMTERRSVAFDPAGRKIPLPESQPQPFDVDIS